MINQLSRKFLEENFVCKRCGNCCKWHGYVNVSIEEIEAIAKFLGIDFNEYKRLREILFIKWEKSCLNNAKAEAKAQRRLDAAKVAARKAIAEKIR